MALPVIPIPHIELRPVDKKRLAALHERSTTELKSGDTGYCYSALCQCFLPYQNPETEIWNRKNGDYSIMLQAGYVEDDSAPTGFRCVGLPYGAKPRLFNIFLSTRAVKLQSKILPVEETMCAMMRALGFDRTGGEYGTIAGFKDQIMRFVNCSLSIVGPGPKGGRRYAKTSPISRFDVFFSREKSIWPHEIELTEEFYGSLACHAVPINLHALRSIQQKPRSLDIYCWMAQRLCRIPATKPLLLSWRDLHAMFGGECSFRQFKPEFRESVVPVQVCYPGVRLEETPKGFLFRQSPPPIPAKTRIFVKTKPF